MTEQAAVLDDICLEVERLAGLKVRSGVLGAKLTTFAVGGQISRFVEVQSETELCQLLKILSNYKQAYRVIGAGSNLLISDRGVSEWVVKLGPGFRFTVKLPGNKFDIGGSTSLMSLSRELSEAGYSGLEFAGGIPASVGGATIMNAGAHHGQFSDVLRTARVVMQDGSIEVINASELKFAYRHSELPKGSVVIGVSIELVESDPINTRQKRADCLAERKKRQPLTLPSAGSVFKNPSTQQSAGFVIEQCGLKGSTIGGAQISEVHANWIVNPERQASSSDVLELIRLCQENVSQKFGLILEPEVISW